MQSGICDSHTLVQSKWRPVEWLAGYGAIKLGILVRIASCGGGAAPVLLLENIIPLITRRLPHHFKPHRSILYYTIPYTCPSHHAIQHCITSTTPQKSQHRISRNAQLYHMICYYTIHITLYLATTQTSHYIHSYYIVLHLTNCITMDRVHGITHTIARHLSAYHTTPHHTTQQHTTLHYTTPCTT